MTEKDKTKIVDIDVNEITEKFIGKLIKLSEEEKDIVIKELLSIIN